jgi:prepilin-type N-terminal cleavage/methylation domain-containing protein
MNINKQKGFTLVEIAIVLVIIGLLLGGILKGQELISSARVRNLADQNSGIQAAYYGFIDRYRQVPGDWSGGAATTAMGVTVIGGNGNSRIDNTTEEASAVWAQLAKSNFIGGGFTPATTATSSTLLYRDAAPRNAFNGALTLTRNSAYSGSANTRLNLHIGNNVPVAIARELDVKVDDSKPNSGVLRLGLAGDSEFSSIHSVGGSATCAPDNTAAADFDIASDGTDCGQVFLY